MEKFELKVVDEEILQGYKWEIDNPKGRIVIMEGMEEHIARYARFAEFLNSKGYSVYGLDAYGQGLNVKKDFSNVGVWPNEGFAKQVIANDILIEKLKENKEPVYLFCHSMGSFMGQDYIQRFPGHVDKIVLCGAGGKNGGVPIALFFARIFITKKKAKKKSKILNKIMFGGFNKRVKKQRTDCDWLAYDEESVNRYIADPLCGFGPNCGFCLEFLKGMSRLYKTNGLKKINKDQKIYLIGGREDPVTGYGKYTDYLEKTYKKLGIKDVRKKIYDNARHEILNDYIKEEVYEDVYNFFNN